MPGWDRERSNPPCACFHFLVRPLATTPRPKMSPALGSGEQVGSQTGQDAAAEFGIPFVEVSAKTGANVREAFMFVTTRAVGEHLVRDRLKQSTGRARRRSVKTTMQTVPELQVCSYLRVCVFALCNSALTVWMCASERDGYGVGGRRTNW